MNHKGMLTTFATALIVGTLFLPVACLNKSATNIETKFEPWLWDKLLKLETNGTSRKIRLMIDLEKNESITGMGIEMLKAHAAQLLMEKHDGEDVDILHVLPGLTVTVTSKEAKTIAEYDFIKLIGDGEIPIEFFSDRSTRSIHAHNVWGELNYNGSGVYIAIIDNGINESHPALANKINGRHWKFPGCKSYWGDHGTHVAGIAAGTGEGTPTVADPPPNAVRLCKGVAPAALLLNVKLRDGGSREDTRWGIDRVLEWVEANPDASVVINLSGGHHIPGGCNCDGCVLCGAIKAAVVDYGIPVVVAAGNDGKECDPPESIICPGCSPYAITVGAVNNCETTSIHDDELVPFSSRGPTRDGRTKPDVVAPGWTILSPEGEGGYSLFHNTSAATPHVSGVVALMMQAHPDWTPAQIKSVLKGTAMLNEHLLELSENDRGKGIVDAYRAVTNTTGLGNPSFEQKLITPTEPAHWLIISPGWRELRGDCSPHPPNGNGDGIVDIRDIAMISRAFSSTPGDPGWNPYAELNGDGIVDIRDLSMAAREFGKETNSTDGSYSWYICEEGSVAWPHAQFLCEFDVNASRLHEYLTFSFLFKPKSTSPDGKENYVQARIICYNSSGSCIKFEDSFVYPNETRWYNASVVSTIPAWTRYIEIRFFGHNDHEPNFLAWIDDATTSS